ncbi:urea ABC transporter ATP-binding subunit UrtE [Terasakiella sp. A23]|uniref:urea ABC transporter ATP-binding subunit UrtE n=1 Tax=Terasakiella sp. FCG-A23 TaxID=3080561 RepID=UPI002953D811|nr:urea ABC transporter ATP-binding subunit UrtE [Terasakiella sp. A23]MDV7339579.1 urea ABC transporter ATP-binding subunit UrtE [Terasakiella sp. A23]
MLAVENVDLYYGASQALKTVAFEAEIGKVTTVLGRNGVGKTSLMKAVVGQQAIQSGTVVLEGDDITAMAAYDRAAKGIAYVPQGREIFPLLTVEENLKTGYASLPRSLRHVPDEIFELFPVLKDMLGRRGGDLSGGQQQQLAIARALVTRPRLLVLDEPTEGIQPSIIKDIERVIRLLANRGDMAILLVEQYFEFAHALADYIVVMDRGEVVMKGEKDDLVEEEVRRYLTV